ncbi:unnamed protein product, partial [marine sediment metagenome]
KNIAITCVASDTGIHVPKIICGRKNAIDTPTAAPELFANVAAIRPKPTEDRARSPTNANVKKNPGDLILNPNGKANTVIITTCKKDINTLEII